jgi:hypothetical protein
VVMDAEGDQSTSRKRKRHALQETGPYILRTLVDELPIKVEEDDPTVTITCVELWGK